MIETTFSIGQTVPVPSLPEVCSFSYLFFERIQSKMKKGPLYFNKLKAK